MRLSSTVMKNCLKDLRHQGFFDWGTFIDDHSLIKTAITEIEQFIEQDTTKSLEYNYGGSEVRIWNAQNVIPSVNLIYDKLKELNRSLFGDGDDFCILAIVTSPCTQEFFPKRWHVDSLSNQRKFFLHLTDVSLSDGPFEFFPYTHTILTRFLLTLQNLGKSFYFSRSFRFKTYQAIDDAHLPLSSKRVPYTCSKGDLLIADVRMLHRDAPCLGGYRVALHCYLGCNPGSFPTPLSNAK